MNVRGGPRRGSRGVPADQIAEEEGRKEGARRMEDAKGTTNPKLLRSGTPEF